MVLNDNNDIITMSYDVITSHWPHLWTYYLSSKPRFHSFYSCKVMGVGGRVRQTPEEGKKPDLNRVKGTQSAL